MLRTARRRLGLLLVAAASAVGLALVPALPASAALPPAGAASYRWLSAACTPGTNRGNDVYWLHAQLRSDVLAPGDLKHSFYQRVKLTFQVAPTVDAAHWATLDSKTRDGSRFARGTAPTYSIVGFRSIVGPTLATSQVFRVRAIVKLKRVTPGTRVPDLTSWKYEAYTAAFSCGSMYGVS